MCRFGTVSFVLLWTCMASSISCLSVAPREVPQEAQSKPTTPDPARAFSLLNGLLPDKTKTKPVFVLPKPRPRPVPEKEDVVYIPYPYQTPNPYPNQTPNPYPYPYPYPYPAPEPVYPSSLQINSVNTAPAPSVIQTPPASQPIQIAPVLQTAGAPSVIIPAAANSSTNISTNPSVTNKDDERLRELQSLLQRMDQQLRELQRDVIAIRDKERRGIIPDTVIDSLNDLPTDENAEESESPESGDPDDYLDVSKLNNEEPEDGTPAIVIEKGYLVLLKKNEFTRLPANSALTILQ